MKCRLFQLIAIVTLCGFPRALWAMDYFVVESKTVPAGATDVMVMIKVANSDTLIGLTLPLEIRSLTGGARPASMRPGFAERFLEKMDEIKIVSQYDVKSGICG